MQCEVTHTEDREQHMCEGPCDYVITPTGCQVELKMVTQEPPQLMTIHMERQYSIDILHYLPASQKVQRDCAKKEVVTRVEPMPPC